MCGIIGYLGEREAIPILIEGLKRLEYRGYDSAGIAVFDHDRIEVKRCMGKVSGLENLFKTGRNSASVGIGHTRWATHGRPSEENAHPHTYEGVAVVHNGIIENYLTLKNELKSRGHHFSSETDTEIISHLIAENLQAGLKPLEALRKALAKVEGSYALAVLIESHPDILLAARNQSPLILGLGNGEMFVASDSPAILPYTRQVIFLEDGDLVQITQSQIKIETQSGASPSRPIHTISWDDSQAEKGGYKHFMLKEIFEQPQAVADTLRGRISVEQGDVFLEGLEDRRENFLSAKRIYLVACGTSYHAGLVGRYYFERFCLLPSEAELASEFRHRNPIIGPETLMILISQSGETADTLKALREGKAKGCPTLAICNVLGSSISRMADFTLYTHAGPEIGVASTKAFSTQIIALYLTALALARDRSLVSPAGTKDKIQELLKIPQLIKKCLGLDPEIQMIARKFSGFQNFLYLGRGINYPLALEGALKLKEISYIHAEGYPAGEMKHGPIALIDREMPVLALATHGEGRDKIRSNIEEARARCGRVIALVNEGDEEIAERVEETIAVPRTQEELQPILNIIPLQLLAYHIAVIRGTNIDQPRNLAKSVTVE
ncbi:MAG: glutamine--fructose-6-phosphate transaminase (isomerizing) [Proteobacteria bacterium]|nr:glutamine--fructose-6-phosphate transaminase (isomerizing) [Pseudomonadota bacterium]